jgi:hypothetical protein
MLVPSSTDTSVSRTVLVGTAIERAFAAFAEGMGYWWPPDHHIAEAPFVDIVVQPRIGGRWYECAADGAQCDWGRVLAWDPPRHLALSWHLDGSFTYDPDPLRASRVDVTFVAIGATTTRLDLVHSDLDRHGERWPRLLDGIASPNGWSGVLARYALRAPDWSPAAVGSTRSDRSHLDG